MAYRKRTYAMVAGFYLVGILTKLYLDTLYLETLKMQEVLQNSHLFHELELNSFYPWNLMSESKKTSSLYEKLVGDIIDWNDKMKGVPEFGPRKIIPLPPKPLNSDEYNKYCRRSFLCFLDFLILLFAHFKLWHYFLRAQKKRFPITGDFDSSSILDMAPTGSVPFLSPMMKSVPLFNGYMEAEIEGKKIKIFSDSGCYTSLMSLKKAKELRLTRYMKYYSRVTVQLFIGEARMKQWHLPPMTVKLKSSEGEYSVDIKIIFTVVEHYPNQGDWDVMLGAEALERYNVVHKYFKDTNASTLYFDMMGDCEIQPEKKKFNGHKIYELNSNAFLLKGNFNNTLVDILIDTGCGADFGTSASFVERMGKKENNSGGDHKGKIPVKFNLHNGLIQGDNVVSSNSDMILGVGIFKKYSCIIDFGKKVLYFHLDGQILILKPHLCPYESTLVKF